MSFLGIVLIYVGLLALCGVVIVLGVIWPAPSTCRVHGCTLAREDGWRVCSDHYAELTEHATPVVPS